MAKKNSYGEYMKRMAQYDENRYFGKGNCVHSSGSHSAEREFRFKHVLDGDTVIINTANLKLIKGCWVLLVGNADAVYLKNWQIKQVEATEGMAGSFFLVKLIRQYYKVYHFHSDFEGYDFDKVESFDDQVQLAKEQDERELAVRKVKGTLFN